MCATRAARSSTRGPRKARVTAGTYSHDQILHRAEQWEHGSGPHIDRGFKNPAFAQRIRELVA
jgi:hypothetical protein